MVHPRPKQGSGKNGNVIKRDWCARLVEVVCKGISAEEKKSIVDSMCSPPKEDVDVELLCAMSQLSPEENFAALSKVAMQTLDQKVYGSCEKATAEQAKKVTLEEAQAPLNAKLPKLQEGHRAATSENHYQEKEPSRACSGQGTTLEKNGFESPTRPVSWKLSSNNSCFLSCRLTRINSLGNNEG